MLVTTQPEGLPSSNDLDNLDPADVNGDAGNRGERAEIYVSGAHVCTLDDAPGNRDRITMLVDLEVIEETVRANGDEDVPIRKCKRIGDMYLPGTQRPPSKEEARAEQIAAKARAAREQAEREEAERAEAEHNELPMFDEDGDPIEHSDEPAADGEDQGDDAPPAEVDSTVVQFSNAKDGKK